MINLIKKFKGFYGEYYSGNDLQKASNDFTPLYDQAPLSLSLCQEKKEPDRYFDSSTQRIDSVVALFYGEIYNIDQLNSILDIEDRDEQKFSFSQICCLLYKRFGFEFAKKINGMFSIILYDKQKETLLLIADRYGMARPIYFKQAGGLSFSSSLKKIIQKDKSGVEIDTDSLALFLKYSYVPAPRTILKDVQKLNHGEMLICTKNDIKKKRYFSFDEILPEQTSKDTDETIDEYLNILENSIKRKMCADQNERLGCFLSGGLDSSAAVAIASKYEDKKISTFGIGFDDSAIDERPFAKIVSEHFNVPFYDYVFTGEEIENLPQIIWGLEEPFIENGVFLTYAGIKAASGHVDAIMAGDGADQLFGTGGFAGGSPIALRYVLDKLFLRNAVSKLKVGTRNRMFYKDNFLYKLKTMANRATDFNDWFFWGFDNFELEKILIAPPQKEVFNIFDNKIDTNTDFSGYYKISTIKQDIEHYVCQNVISKSFRLSDQLGVTIREVYLDNEVVDFLLKTNLNFLRKGKLIDYLRRKTTTKYLHRLSMKDILPEKILNKPKQGGFVPMSSLLSSVERRRKIYSFIKQSQIFKNLFNSRGIEEILSQYEVLCHKDVYWYNHRDAMAGKVLSLLSIALWHDIFFEKKYSKCPRELLSDFI